MKTQCQRNWQDSRFCIQAQVYYSMVTQDVTLDCYVMIHMRGELDQIASDLQEDNGKLFLCS